MFDVVEFVGRYVAEPKAGASHPYYGHYTLTFNRGSGALAFRDDVNELLRAGGAAYSMVSNMTIERLVPEELSATLSALNPATGDDILDAAIERGRTLLRSRREDERLVALQTLWDAFEHVKTLDQPGQNQKKQSSEQLLSRVEPEQLRDEVRKDMLAVTDLGNRFRIRHHESHVPAVPDDSYDYFAGRITSLLLLLLRYSERLE